MQNSFRQSMTWLHTWVGLLAGWILFFVFLTGTFGYVNAEVDRWMRPELPLIIGHHKTEHLMALAFRHLEKEAQGAELWHVRLPRGRDNSYLVVTWRPPSDGIGNGETIREVLNPATGERLGNQARETGGGTTLYVMHYALHYMPREIGYCIVGICSIFMLVAISTGIVAHKRLITDFFTLRLGRGQRSWLDGHNMLGVVALPFHVMITWSGLIFFLFTYMPVGMSVLYPKSESRERFRIEAYGMEPTRMLLPGAVAPLIQLELLLPKVEKIWGADNIEHIVVENPGRDNSVIVFHSRELQIARTQPTIGFHGVTGEPQTIELAPRTAPGRFNSLMLALHEGRFAGPWLRFLYLVASLAGTAMIATGLLLWSTKRKVKLVARSAPHPWIKTVDILNLGTVIGLPIGIAAYFWANRLLPGDMVGRATWEVHTMFITWGLTYILAIWRRLDRAWLDLCRLAAAAYGLIPILNALTTDRHVLNTVREGDWAVAGFDLSAFAVGLFFIFLARLIRSQRRQAMNRLRTPPIASESETA